MLNPIFKSLSELNISFLPNALASRNYLKAFLKCLLTIFKRISKVIPSQASVLFLYCLIFKVRLSCDSFIILPQPLSFVKYFFQLFSNFFQLSSLSFATAFIYYHIASSLSTLFCDFFKTFCRFFVDFAISSRQLDYITTPSPNCQHFFRNIF